MEKYECCICKDTVSRESESSPLDPCALVLVSNIEQPRDNQKEQQFFCHFECFRKLVNNDGVMYIMDLDAATIGEIERDEENWSEDESRA
jgi:hypothetical protein